MVGGLDSIREVILELLVMIFCWLCGGGGWCCWFDCCCCMFAFPDPIIRFVVLFRLASAIILGSLCCGVADITLSGTGGIGVGSGCLASNEASILFLRHNLPSDLLDETPSPDRFELLSSRSSLGLFLPRLSPFVGDGEFVKPKLRSSVSSWDCISGFWSSSFSSWWSNSLGGLMPALTSLSSSSLFSFSNWKIKKKVYIGQRKCTITCKIIMHLYNLLSNITNQGHHSE